ncbi:sucrase ferredoxin [Streptomyces lydicus]|uniref:sucrase ferredoxin n=1 Tax=Streptomyces lydicus TaxID=47763 RepID=UPI00286FB84D|nr:sucrase ferredoxin [Streptomyces lydicus]
MSLCATASREADEPLAGTAATARTWLLVEQTGPWGAKALTASHLDPALGRALEAAAKGTGVRVALIRRPGRHADRHDATRHRLFLAHTAPGRSWIRTTTVADPQTALGLDFAALGAGDHGDLWEPYTGEPLVLVCTNGKRDRCCALLGRPLAADLAAAGTEVWEVTHIGGHRFAPTLFVLPYGYAYGRTSLSLAADAVVAARSGRIALDHCRGRSTWDRPAQAADLAVRELLGEDRADVLDVVRTDRLLPQSSPPQASARPQDPAPSLGSPPPQAPEPPHDTTSRDTAVTGEEAPAWTVTVAHSDGRAWRVTVEQRADGAPAPASCGAPLAPPARMAVTAVTAVTATADSPALSG